MKHKFLVPILTPFNADESVDYDALKKLTRALLDDGADGIYAGGSSAECFLLTEEERKKTLETVVAAADGAYVLAHIGCPGTKCALELARHAKRAGADAVASVPPFYYAFPFEGVLSYYRDLAGVGLPVTVYSLPSTRKMSVEEYRALLSVNGVCWLKYTDGDYFVMQQIIAATGAEIYSGKDECFLSALAAGAKGAIGTTFNFMLYKYKNIERLFREGKPDAALAEQTSANAVTACLLENNIMATSKYLASLRYGVNLGGARRPFLPLSEENKKAALAVAERELGF